MGNRGNWGNGDSHGNTPPLLKAYKGLKKGEVHTLTARRFPEFWKDGKLTYEGEKFLARIDFLFPVLREDFGLC